MRHLITPAGLVCALAAGSAPANNPFADQPKADDVFYHFMPIAWRDGDNDPNRDGDFIGMRDGLPYLQELGITAVWMNPIFPSPAYHGYQHGRADEVNPRFGTEQQFIDFVTDANSRGIETYLDFVVYGISHNSPWYQSAAGNPSSVFDDYLAFTNGSNTTYQGYTFTTWSGDPVGFIHWDLRNPETVRLNADWAVKWLDPNADGDFSDGVSGYRLDHVWRNYGDGPDGWGYNLDTFWNQWHSAIRAANPDVFTFAEQHDWGSHGAELLPEFDAAMTKPFEFAARDALWNETAGPLYAQMRATIDTLPSGLGTYVAIIGDHDVDRLASAIGADSPARIGRAEAAAAVLMLQPFPPVIYYGDEIAMTGVKGNYGSDANDIPMREPFKWNAVEGAPMTRYHRINAPAYSNQFSRNDDGRSVEEQGTTGVLTAYRDLISARHAHVALRRGDYDEIDASSSRVWAFMRSYEQGDAPIPDADQAIAVAINLRGAPVTTTLDLSGFVPAGSTLPVTDLAPDGGALPDITDANRSSYQVTIPAYGYALLEGGFTPPPEPRFTIDGSLDAGYVEVAVSTGGSIWAGLDGGRLYIATQPAGDSRDRFILVAEEPGAMGDAVWAKAGQMAAPDAYIGNEADNGWSGWFDTSNAGGPATGLYLEGWIDLGDQFGSVPEGVHLAALSYLTGDGDPLDAFLQVPFGNGDGDVTGDEYVYVSLNTLEPCLADINNDGALDFFDISAFLALYAESDPDADLNNDGAHDFFDVSLLLSAYQSGCP